MSNKSFAEFQARCANRTEYSLINNLGSRPEYLRRFIATPLPPGPKKSGARPCPLTLTDDPDLGPREWRWAGCNGRIRRFLNRFQNDNIVASNKKSPRTEEYAQRVEIFHRNGRAGLTAALCWASIMIGRTCLKQPSGGSNSNDWNVRLSTFLTPYPGTPLFEQMERDGATAAQELAGCTTPGTSCFQPKQMTPAQLADGYAWLLPPSYFHIDRFWRAAVRRELAKCAAIPGNVRTSTSDPTCFGIS